MSVQQHDIDVIVSFAKPEVRSVGHRGLADAHGVPDLPCSTGINIRSIEPGQQDIALFTDLRQ